MSSPLLQVDDLYVEPVDGDGDSILRGLNLTIGVGELHAIVGPNGAGKSTLGSALLGSPAYRVISGTMTFDGDDITTWPTAERAKLGMFLGFQHPVGLPGVTIGELLRHACAARPAIDLSVTELRSLAAQWMVRLGLDASFLNRQFDDGLSTGEARRCEIVQMALLAPSMAMLDDIDAGLDTAGLENVASAIAEIRSRQPEIGIIVVTNSTRFLHAVAPSVVHMMIDGRIVARGGVELVVQLEATDDAPRAYA